MTVNSEVITALRLVEPDDQNNTHDFVLYKIGGVPAPYAWVKRLDGRIYLQPTLLQAKEPGAGTE